MLALDTIMDGRWVFKSKTSVHVRGSPLRYALSNEWTPAEQIFGNILSAV